MAESNLDIKIRTSADTAGASAAAASLKGVEAASKDVASVNESAEKRVARTGAAFGVLSSVVRGDVAGAFRAVLPLAASTGRAIAILTGPIGIVIGGLVLLASTAKKAFEEKRENRIKADADAAADSLKATEEAAKELGEQRLETLNAALKAVATNAANALADLESALELAAKVADAEDQLAEARDAADPNLSEEARVTRRAARAEAAATRRSATAEAQAQGVVKARMAPRDAASAAETSAAENYSRITGQLEALRGSRATAQATIASSRAQLSAEYATLNERNLPAPQAQAIRSNQLRAAAAREASAFETLRGLDSESGRTREAGLAAAQTAALKELNAANAAAIQAAEELAAAESRLAGVRKEQAAVGPLEAETRKIRTSQEAAAARQRDAEARDAGALDLLGADAANTGTRMAMKLQRSGAYASNPDVKSAADALAAAADAARQGGTTAGEMSALIDALSSVRAVLAENGRSSAVLMREISALKSQTAALASRANNERR